MPVWGNQGSGNWGGSGGSLGNAGGGVNPGGGLSHPGTGGGSGGSGGSNAVIPGQRPVTAPGQPHVGQTPGTRPDGWTPDPAHAGQAPASTPAAQAVDFLAMARALYPWLPEELLQIFASAWDQHGNAEVALGVMRQSPAYDTHFPGNRRDNGTFRLTEQEYMTTVDGFQQSVAQYGLNPSVFAGKFQSLIEGDVSVNEFAGRLSQAWNMMNTGPQGAGGVSQTMAYYAEAYGIAMTPEAVFGTFIDPDLAQDVLNRRIAVAEVGGGALAYGFQRSVERVERLMGVGLTGDQAVRFYAGAAAQLPQAQALARRFYNRDGVDVGTLEDAGILGDYQQGRRLQGNVTAEVVSFNRQQTAGRDQQGRVFGLERQ